MYCQKCGRKLKTGMRFCDYCGSPVGGERRGTYGAGDRNNYQQRKTPSAPPKRESAETIKRRAQMERNRKKREQERIRARKNRRNAILAVFLALVAAVLLAWVSNGWMSKELEKDDPKTANTEVVENVENEEDAEVTEESSEEDEDLDKSEKTKTESKKYSQIAKEFDEYTDDRMDNISGVYPKDFETSEKPNSNALEAFKDPEGKGTVTYSVKQVGTSAKGEDLLSDYTDGLGGDIIDEDADSNWYAVTFERTDKINHRMAVIVDGLCVYYDFVYPSDSDMADTYDEYIEYMDYYLMEKLDSVSEENESDE